MFGKLSTYPQGLIEKLSENRFCFVESKVVFGVAIHFRIWLRTVTWKEKMNIILCFLAGNLRHL